MQKVIQSYLSAFATSYVFQADNVSLWLHYCKLRKKVLLNQQGRHWANFWTLQPYMSKLMSTLVFQEVLYQKILLASLTEPLGNIVPWYKDIFYQCCLLTRNVTRGANPPRKNFAPPGKMCWTYIKAIGHSLKKFSPSQKTLRPPGTFNQTRSLSIQANHLRFTKPTNCVFLWWNYLLEAESLDHNQNSQ